MAFLSSLPCPELENSCVSSALKTNELGQRYLNTSDKKLQEFHLIRTKCNMLKKEDPKFESIKYIDEEYEKYCIKWNPK